MDTKISIADTDAEIEACFPAFSALRPKLERSQFLPQVRRQQNQDYQIVALWQDGIVKSAAGFRHAEYLAWGKVIYIDDLTTLPGETGQGLAAQLLDWLIARAQADGCQGVHLDTGYERHIAHRLYLRKGFLLQCHHMSLDIAQ